MRRVAILAIVLGSCGGGAAMADPAAPNPVAAALAEAAFVHSPAASSPEADPIGRLLDQGEDAGGLMRWRTGEAPLSDSADGPMNSLRISMGSPDLGRGGLPLALGVQEPAYEVSVIHHWRRAISFDAGGIDLDVSPHAGVGLGSDGSGSAEAGATLQLSRGDRLSELARRRLQALGVEDGAQFGDRGRFYLFAAASGRAVGLNMLHGESGWNRAGWTTDPASRLVGDAQVGVGWRKGAMQTSLGFVHREVKGDHMMYGVDPHADSMVAFSFSLKPRVR